jgi:hypothetical protein
MHRIFGVRRAYSIWIYILGYSQLANTIASIIVNALQCIPINKVWDPSVTGARCVQSGAWVAGVESTNSGIDLGITILAMVMIRSVQMRTSTKWKLAAVFALGAL